MAESEIDDERIAAVCRVLNEHRVEFVVIGGVAARLHDTGHATVDIDICPSSVDANLERLAAALRSIDTRLRVEGEPAGIPFDPHPKQLRQMSTLTLLTTHGPRGAVLRSRRVRGRLRGARSGSSRDRRLRGRRPRCLPG